MSIDKRLQKLPQKLEYTADFAIRQLIERQQRLSQRLLNIMNLYVRVQDNKIQSLQSRLDKSVSVSLFNHENKIARLEDKLQLLDPVKLLRRGYSITFANGKVVRNVEMLKKGQLIETVLHDGKVESIVT